MTTKPTPAAEIGDYVTGFGHGPSKIVKRSWDYLDGWLYELENGAILGNDEITLDNLLLESEVL